MASITIDCIEIQGITEPYLLHDLRLDLAPNDHGHATLVLEIKEDGKAEIRLVTATIQMNRKRELFLPEERNEIHGDSVGNGRKRRGCLHLYRR